MAELLIISGKGQTFEALNTPPPLFPAAAYVRARQYYMLKRLKYEGVDFGSVCRVLNFSNNK